MAEERWSVASSVVAGAMIGSREGELFARGRTVLRRGDAYLIVTRWEADEAVGTRLDTESWQRRQEVDEATTLAGPRASRGLALWIVGPRFGDRGHAEEELRALGSVGATWPHDTPRWAYWVDELRCASLRDEWANSAAMEAAAELASNAKCARDLAEYAFHLRRLASLSDAALYVAAAEAAGDPHAGALLRSMQLSFERQRSAFDRRLRSWRSRSSPGQRYPSDSLFPPRLETMAGYA